MKIVCQEHKDDDPTYVLRVMGNAGRTYDVLLQEGTKELLWAPDSTAFFVNGGTSGYSGYFLTIYEMTSDGPIRHQITDAAEKDMVETYPPCKAANREETGCKGIVSHPEYNMSGVGWAEDSRSVSVFSEIPCSSSYGGIMCQVAGYQLGLLDGRIIKRLTAAEVKLQWKGLMAWRMNVPDPPIYGQP